MSDINRCLVTVKPKQPLLDWLRRIDDNREGLDDLASLQFDSIGYLVPEYADDKEQQEILQEFYHYIFESELESWDMDESEWPQNRDLTMFLAWFDVEFHSVVYDLAEGLPMRDEDYMDEPDDADWDED